MQEMQVWSLGGKDPPEEEMATHSSVLTWKIPWIEPGILSPWVAKIWTLSNRAHKMLLGVYRSLPGTGLKAVCPVTLAGHIDFVKLGLIAWKLLYLASHKQNTNCCCSVAQSCLTLCNLMDCGSPDSSAVHCLPGLLVSTESVTLSNHAILCLLFLPLGSVFLSIRSFPMSRLLISSGQSIKASAWTMDLAINSPG